MINTLKTTILKVLVTAYSVIAVAAALFVTTNAASGASVCTPLQMFEIQYDKESFPSAKATEPRRAGIDPLWTPPSIWPSLLSGEGCDFTSCLLLDNGPDGGLPARMCIAYTETNIRGGLKFFSDAFDVRLDPVRFGRLPRKVLSVTEKGLLANGDIKTFSEAPDQILDARHENGNRLILIDATLDSAGLARKGQPPIAPNGIAEMTVIRYNPRIEGWLRLSCYDFSTREPAAIRDTTLALTRALKFVETCAAP